MSFRARFWNFLPLCVALERIISLPKHNLRRNSGTKVELAIVFSQVHHLRDLDDVY